jgi:UDP-2,3-diacylglucosamine pyrophosphatase LpxH
MTFQLASDLHLEFQDRGPYRLATVCGDYLLLAGDIITVNSARAEIKLSELLSWAADNYQKVFYVSGNHEYYHNNREHADAYLARLCERWSNVYFLQRESLALKIGTRSVRLHGCTLWSATARPVGINDYQLIKHADGRLIGWRDTLAWHLGDYAWLQQSLSAAVAADPAEIQLVLTHHLPSFQLIAPQWTGHPINIAFATELPELLKLANIWCCGHTHVGMQQIVENCRVYINPRGYPDENPNYKDLAISLT